MSDHRETDRRVVVVMASSVLFSTVHRALATVWRAAEGSVVADSLSHWAGEWSGLEPARQRLMVGAMLIMAAVTHVILTLATLTPPGWIWLVLPGMAGATGLLIVASGFPGVTRR